MKKFFTLSQKFYREDILRVFGDQDLESFDCLIRSLYTCAEILDKHPKCPKAFYKCYNYKVNSSKNVE